MPASMQLKSMFVFLPDLSIALLGIRAATEVNANTILLS